VDLRGAIVVDFISKSYKVVQQFPVGGAIEYPFVYRSDQELEKVLWPLVCGNYEGSPKCPQHLEVLEQ
jgi:hypothetical protein